MKEKNVKLWSKNFIIIIIVNFLVFLNHISDIQTAYQVCVSRFFALYQLYAVRLSAGCLITESEN